MYYLFVYYLFVYYLFVWYLFVYYLFVYYLLCAAHLTMQEVTQAYCVEWSDNSKYRYLQLMQGIHFTNLSVTQLLCMLGIQATTHQTYINFVQYTRVYCSTEILNKVQSC